MINGTHLHPVPTTPADYTRDEAIAEIKAALKARTGRAWSVKGGRGSVWGWITITAQPRQLDQYGAMTDSDRDLLAAALGLDSVHHQGVSIPAGSDYRREYVDRAHGRTPRTIGRPYWD